MKTAVIVSANGEWAAMKSLFPEAQTETTPFGECMELKVQEWPVTFFQGGWGKVSAAASAQYVIDHFQPDLLVNLGTCGGLAGRIEQGTIILVEKTIIYDIIEQMTDSQQAIEHYSSTLDLQWLPTMTPTPVLRGQLVSADRDIRSEDIAGLVSQYDAVAADWESGAIAWVAARNHQRLLILRAVSDVVGEEGGEVYGEYELFRTRAKEIMRNLIEILPIWLDGIEKVR